MAVDRRIFRSFLDDALRMAARALDLIGSLTSEQSCGLSVKRERIRMVYRVVHTIKGTAVMIPGGEPLVESLHEVEAFLQSECKVRLGDLDHEAWGRARRTLDRVQQLLLDIREKMLVTAGEEPEIGAGLLVRTAQDVQLWFPLCCVTRMMTSEELAGQTMVCLGSKWVPVVKTLAEHAAKFSGIALQLEGLQVVLTVSEVLGMVPWVKATRDGAVSGVLALQKMGLLGTPVEQPASAQAA